MPTFPQLIGAALILLALTGPLAYCEVRRQIGHNALQQSCIDARGIWSNAWGGYCSLPPAPKPQ